jgi:hypothetical protein
MMQLAPQYQTNVGGLHKRKPHEDRKSLAATQKANGCGAVNYLAKDQVVESPAITWLRRFAVDEESTKQLYLK